MELNVKSFGLDGIAKFARRGSRDLRLLTIGVCCAMFGNGVFSAAYNNFIVEKLNIHAGQLGIVEGIRESAGLVIVFVVAMTMQIAEPIVAAGALVVFAIGLGAYYGVTSVPSLIVWSLVYSIGLHAWMTVQPSMTMNLASEGNKGTRLGQLAAVSALGTLLGMALVMVIGKHVDYRLLFLLSGATIVIGAAAICMMSKDIGHVDKPKFVLKTKYWLYYALTFLEGCRKQIFMTFAIFLLVRNFHTSIAIVALLMILNNVANMLYSSWVGSLIDKLGERRVLMFCYAAAIPVFLGYASTSIPILLYVFYFLDNFFYIGNMGSATYIQRISEPQDLQPSLAMGVSFNHVAAVAVPLIGGFLWYKFGYRVTFYGGAVASAISVLMVYWMKSGTKRVES
jgi:predicted MFS family arabinose efflux permease